MNESPADIKFEKHTRWMLFSLIAVVCIQMMMGWYLHAIITTQFLICNMITCLRKDNTNILLEIKETNIHLKELNTRMKYDSYRHELNRIRASYNSKIPDGVDCIDK